jgi:hypothetical protein
VRIEGYFGTPGLKTTLDEKLDATPPDREVAIRTLRDAVRAALDTIEAEQRANPIRDVTTLPEALHALLDRVAQRLGGTITRVEANDRSFLVRVAGRAEPVRGDRAMILTLLHDIWGDAAFPAGCDPRYAVREAELAAYLGQLAAIDEEETRALYVHLHSAYQTQFAPDASDPIASLFPSPVWAAKNLNASASATRLIRRALPHAADGTLTDRTAAFSVIATAIGSTNDSDAGFAGMQKELRALLTTATRDEAPLLREVAWFLARELESRDQEGA